MIRGWIPFGLITFIGAMVFSAHCWRSIFVHDRLRFRPLARFTNAIELRIPILQTLPLSQGLSRVFYVLGDQAAAQEPLQIELASSIPENQSLRRKIYAWADVVRAGVPLDVAARRVGLPPLVAGTIGPALLTGSISNAFNFLARYYDQRYSRALILLRGAWIPGMALINGLVIGFVVVSLFIPVVALIQSVSGDFR